MRNKTKFDINKDTVFHNLFEQSSTFTQMFRDMGHQSYCYDLQNEYGKTDFIIDIFKHIEIAFQIITEYDLKKLEGRAKYTGWSIQAMYNENLFFKMHPDRDMILAFFPCDFFSELNDMVFSGYSVQRYDENGNTIPNTTKENVLRIIDRIGKRKEYFAIFTKFCFVVEQLGIPTIIENPYGCYGGNYLLKHSLWKPQKDKNGKFIYDKDRTLFGCYMPKPTFYIPINFHMEENFSGLYTDKNNNPKKSVLYQGKGKERSEISPTYAKNFYKRFLMPPETKPNIQSQSNPQQTIFDIIGEEN